ADSRQTGFSFRLMKPAYIAFDVRFRSLRLPVSSTEPVPLPTAFPIRTTGFDRTCGAVGVDEDALGRASRLDQGKAARRNVVLEQPLSFAEHQRKDPDVIFVDEFGGDQRLQQFTAAPDMQRRPIRRLQPADFIHDITAYVLRVLPVE